MAAVALRWYAMQFVSTPICYVNRALRATVVTNFSRFVNNPGFCNGPLFVNPSSTCDILSPGLASVRGRRDDRHLMGFEEDRAANLG
jgi:hypothetical protein